MRSGLGLDDSLLIEVLDSGGSSLLQSLEGLKAYAGLFDLT